MTVNVVSKITRGVAFALYLTLAFLSGTASSSAQGLPTFCKEAPRSASTKQGGVSLVVSKGQVRVGAVIYARLLNFSAKTVGYGREFAIERRGRSGWTLDPASPDGPWVKSLGKLAPGSGGRCYEFHVPSTQAEGRYRFSTKIIQTGSQAVRTAEFRVE